MPPRRTPKTWLSFSTFSIAAAPLASGFVYFWMCTVVGKSYRYDEYCIGLPALYCALAGTPLSLFCVFFVRDVWSRLAVVAVLADWCLMFPLVQ